MIFKKFFAITLWGALLGGIDSVAADDMNATWVLMHESIRIAELCRHITHNQADWERLGSILDSKVKSEIGPGERLILMEEAKSDAQFLVDRLGCESEDIKFFLQSYDELVTP